MKNIFLSLKILMRFRTYTAINIVGLALSLASVFVLVRYIHQELTVNDFIPDIDRKFMTVVRSPTATTGTTIPSTATRSTIPPSSA